MKILKIVIVICLVILLAFFFFLGIIIYSFRHPSNIKEGENLYGYVYDCNNNIPLKGVMIFSEQSNCLANTDSLGFFIFSSSNLVYKSKYLIFKQTGFKTDTIIMYKLIRNNRLHRRFNGENICIKYLK